MDKELLDYFGGDELATKVWLDKYATEGETTPSDMHMRMAVQFAITEYIYVLESRNYINNEQIEALSDYGQDSLLLNEEELPSGELLNFLVEKYFALFDKFKYIIPQGSIMYGLGRGTPVSLSNCFVIAGPEDSYGGIYLIDEEQAQLMKRRGGVGHDLSNLRPKGTKVLNSAKHSTGAVSFAHRYSNTTREVAQDGRRGALMLSIDINHPDSLDFIKSKRDRTSLTGANISVRLNNDFIEAVVDDKDYILRFPCDKKFSEDVDFTICKYDKLIPIDSGYIKRIKAKEYWNEIVHSAKGYAEPGLLYWDRILNYAPDGVYDRFKAVGTNPCGEIPMGSYDSCRLIALNLFSFVDKPFTNKATIDYDKLYEISYEQQKIADNIIDLEVTHIDKILEKIKNDDESYIIKEREIDLWTKIKKTTLEGRRTGGGFTAFGDILAAINVRYGSDKSLEVIDKIGKTMMQGALDCSIDLAILRGRFPAWDRDLEFTNNLMDGRKGKNDFFNMLLEEFPEQVKKMWKYGRRNISWSTIAPTGTVSLMTQTTSGIEPLFMPFYKRKEEN